MNVREQAIARPTDPISQTFFSPSSIAVVGAAAEPVGIRGRLLYFIILNGFRGKIYPVNPSHEVVQGLAAYPTVTAIGEPVDLALIAIPARFVVSSVEDCVRAGVKNIIIISSGFAEEGGAASALQEQLRLIAARSGVRIAGPNCEGFYSAVSKTAATFSPVVERLSAEPVTELSDKRVGIVSQSGGQGFALLTKGRERGLRFSHVISTGNEVDLDASDFLEYMVHDPNTDMVVMFCEAIRNGEKFKQAAEAALRLKKPVIVVKVGRSSAGARAAASHTASLTGSYAAYQAVFRAYGVIEANDPDEAMAIAAVLMVVPPPAGCRVGIVTGSGGGGALVADICVANGLNVPLLSDEIQKQIAPLIPPHASPLNPVDITAQGGGTGPVMLKCIRIFEQSDEIDMIVVVTSTGRPNHFVLSADQIADLMQTSAKPILFWSYTTLSVFSKQEVANGRSVILSDVRHIGLTLAKTAEFFEACRWRLADEDSGAPPDGVAVQLPEDGARVLTEHSVKRLIAACVPNAPEEHLVQTADEAVAAAKAVGWPVALKVQSPDVPHKTEAGGVRLNLADEVSLKRALNDMQDSVRSYRPNARIEGYLLQSMAPRGYEFVVGMVNDETFGPIMMVGGGGTTVELYGDVVHAPAPLTPAMADRLLRRLRAACLATGFRGADAVDLTQLSHFISRMSHVADRERHRIREMEFNPVILHADGSGMTIADALMYLM